MKHILSKISIIASIYAYIYPSFTSHPYHFFNKNRSKHATPSSTAHWLSALTPSAYVIPPHATMNQLQTRSA